MSDELHDEHADLTADEVQEETVPDYSRVGFKDLRKLCTGRGLPAGGTQVDLIDRLKAYDAERGLTVDTAVPDVADDVDLLADDDAPQSSPDAPAPEVQPVPAAPDQTPPGAGAAASTPAPDGSAPAATGEGHRRRPNLAAKGGPVRVGEAFGGSEVRAYRREFLIGNRDITDDDHARFIADTHAAAQADGYATKGGITVGERVGYATGVDGYRTAIYQVHLKRQ